MTNRYLALPLLAALAACEPVTEPEPVVEYLVTGVADIDDRGRVLLTVRPDADVRGFAAIWENGVVTVLPYPRFGVLAEVVDMNELGVVIGTVYTEQMSDRKWIYWWEPGMSEARLMETPGDLSYFPTAINDLGMISGVAFDFRDGAQWRYPFVWSESAGFRRLNIADSQWAGAMALNNNGQVVGFYSMPGTLYIQGFTWRAGDGFTDLGNLDGGEVVMHAINEDGVGTGMASDAGYYAVRWTRADGMTKILPEYNFTCGFDINDHGAIVGQVLVGQGDMRAFYWTPAAGTTLLPQGDAALKVNNRGEVIGRVGEWPGESYFIWSAARGYQEIGRVRTTAAPRVQAQFQRNMSLPC